MLGIIITYILIMYIFFYGGSGGGYSRMGDEGFWEIEESILFSALLIDLLLYMIYTIIVL